MHDARPSGRARLKQRGETAMRLIVGISGATGAYMGYRLLQALSAHPDVETYLVVSDAAKRTIECEHAPALEEFQSLADHVLAYDDLAACISSGSFKTAGMIVIPCSMKSLSAIANSYGDNLLTRAADVCLKEGRKVVLVPREMPLSKSHIRNLYQAADNGCVIIPPMLTFYQDYETTESQVDHIIGKILSQFDLEYAPFKPWIGEGE